MTKWTQKCKKKLEKTQRKTNFKQKIYSLDSC